MNESLLADLRLFPKHPSLQRRHHSNSITSESLTLGDAGRRNGDFLRGDLGRGDLGRGDRGLGDLGRGERRAGERTIFTFLA